MLAWQRRPLEALYPVIYLDALVVKVRDGAHVRNKAAHIAVGVDIDGIKHVLGIWVQTTEGAKFWAGGLRRAGQPRRPRRADRLLRRADRVPRGDRGDLAQGDRPDLRGAPDPRRDAVRRTTRTARPSPPRCKPIYQAADAEAATGRARRVRRPPSSGSKYPQHGRDVRRTPGSGSPRSWRSRPSCAGSSTPPTRSSR